jgi:hypothetical protein
MSKTHSFGLCRSGIGQTPLRWAPAIATIAAVLLAGTAFAADVKIPKSAPLGKCVLPDPDAPLGATAGCRDSTYNFSHHRREAWHRSPSRGGVANAAR